MYKLGVLITMLSCAFVSSEVSAKELIDLSLEMPTSIERVQYFNVDDFDVDFTFFGVSARDIKGLTQLQSDFEITLLGQDTLRPYIDVDLRRLFFSRSKTGMPNKVGLTYSLPISEKMTWTADTAVSLANFVGRKDSVNWQSNTAVNVKMFGDFTLSPMVSVVDSDKDGTEYSASVGFKLSF